MRKLIASINVTLDSFCDHTAVIADEELHENFNELFHSADTIIFGRKTYELMESSWPLIVKEPTGMKAMDEFAVLIDNIHKIVFSNTLKDVEWKNTKLANGNLKEEVLKLKKTPGKNILVGGPTLITTLMNLGMIDEFRFCVQPIVLGNGLPLFKNITDRIDLRLVNTKTYGSGVIMLCYEPGSKN